MNPNPLKQKSQNLGLKASLHKKVKIIAHFLLEIPQALCLGFVHIPDIGLPLQIIEQKLVQRCVTHIEAQSCKAS